MDRAYYAKIEDINKLHCFDSEYVRWLNPETDFDLIAEYFSCFGICGDTDTYFGISLNELKTAYLTDECNVGYLCGFIKNGKVLSLAGVEFSSQKQWEICAVSTRPECTGNGFAKSVCSFAAKYILEQHRTAICVTNPSNLAMQAVMRQIGMIRYYPSFA